MAILSNLFIYDDYQINGIISDLLYYIYFFFFPNNKIIFCPTNKLKTSTLQKVVHFCQKQNENDLLLAALCLCESKYKKFHAQITHTVANIIRRDDENEIDISWTRVT